MWIDTFIPYGPEQQLAEAYNRCMHMAQSDWVLLLDHDVYLATNPVWYKICSACIEKVDSSVAMLTCVTYGRNGFDLPVTQSDDIERNMLYAGRIYNEYGHQLENVENYRRAGFFMLVRKTAWIQFPFRDQGRGVNKIDHDFCKRILDSGLTIKVMKGLYVYHRKHRKRSKE
jgi:GT2 family glycosyltransferase